MASLTMFINGQEIQAEEGSTVLDTARAAGIDIPTLCHHPALSNWGGCRMCLIEVEPRGLLHPACTFPVSPGLRVHTHSEKVVRARKYVLQWLFSERSHYCMYCAASGECELQQEAYDHDLNHWLWGRPNDWMPVDASRRYFIMDHNRCILCRRCVRACSEVPAVHTLGTGQRGTYSMIVADLNAPFGESTCISCGTCLQVCPTGALIDRRSAFMGQDTRLDATSSVCAQCSVGCGIVGRTRSDRLVRIEGDWEAPVNGGLLCRLGRFDPMYITARRVTAPLVRVNGELRPATWDEALIAAGQGLSAANQGGLVALVSHRATNEEMAAAAAAFGKGAVALLGGAAVPAAPGATASLQAVESAGAVVAIEADLDGEHEVVACFMRRAFDREAPLHILGGNASRLHGIAVTVGAAGDAAAVAARLADTAGVVVVYGPDAPAEALAAFAGLPGVRFRGLPAGVNTVGAAAAGVSAPAPESAGALYVYAADDPEAAMPAVRARFVVAHAAYHSELTARADVVLPARLWSEKEGHLTNLEGRVQPLRRLTVTGATPREDAEVFAQLADVIGAVPA